MRAHLPMLVVLAACGRDPGQPADARRDALSAPRLVLQLDGGTRPRDLRPTAIVPSDAGALIISEEPWFSDGSGQPPTFLGDLNPGAGPVADFTASSQAVFGGSTFFIGHHPQQRNTLWMTDGTFAGTRVAFDGAPSQVQGVIGATPLGLGLVLRVPGPSGSEWLATWLGVGQAPQSFLELDSRGAVARDFTQTRGGVVFLTTLATRLELIRSDGTSAGTRSLSANQSVLRDLYPPIVERAGVAYLRASTSRYLFATDGSDAGVTSVLDFVDVTGLDRTTADLVLVGRQQGGSSNRTVFFTDGTDAGTRAVLPELVNGGLANPELLGASSTHAFFNARGTTAASVLWAADGTDAGTLEVAPIPARLGTTSDEGLRLATPSRFYFSDALGHPWVSDGTLAGTVQLSQAVSTSHYTAIDSASVFFFASEGGAFNLEPWVTDGTPQGTRMLADLNPGNAGSISSAGLPPRVHQGRAWFPCVTPAHGLQPCVTDGTPAGTRVATPSPGPIPLASIGWLARAGSRLLVGQSLGPVLGFDGTTAERLPFTATGNGPEEDPNGGAWLVNYSQGSVYSLWHTDGTVSGSTQLIADAGFGTYPGLWATARGVFMLTSSATAGDELWAYTPAGGVQVLPDVTPAPGQSSNMHDLVPLGDELAWVVLIPDAGSAVMASDGTAAGTRQLVAPSPAAQYFSWLAPFGGQVYCAVQSSSGTASFARLSADGGVEFILPSLNATAGFARIQPAGRNLFFVSSNTLHRVDPMALTSELLMTNPNGAITELKAVGDGILFIAGAALGAPSTVWFSDGTAAGTRQLNGVFEGGARPSLFNAWGELGTDAFLAHYTRETGLEPGVLVGSAVVPLADLRPGPLSSNPHFPVRVGDSLFFVADDGAGQSVFALDVTVPSNVGGGAGGGAAGGSGGAGGGGGGGGGAGETGGGAGGGGTNPPAGCGCTAGGEWGVLALSLVLARRRRPSPA